MIDQGACRRCFFCNVVPPTCGNYDCRDYYIDLGFIPDSQYEFPITGGEHTIDVAVRDFAGNSANQSFTYTVIGPPVGTLVWQDNFEADTGWVPDPDGTDTVTLGLWERGDPEATYYGGGYKQLGITPSGVNDLVTGRLAGTNSSSYDIDGGVTSIRSPDITLPADVDLVLSFRHYFAHSTNSSSADFLRVKVVGSSTTTVFEELGAADNDNAAWTMENVSITEFTGQIVYLLIEAADNVVESTVVEAAIDDMLLVINHHPDAEPRSVLTPEDTPVDVLLTGSDAEGDPLTFTITSDPSHGMLSGDAPNLTYTPATNYFGSDSFTFLVNDGYHSSEPAVVSIEVTAVNDAPLADLQSISILEDTSLDILLSGFDADSDPLTFTIISSTTHGMLSGVAPDLTYIPSFNYHGMDKFAFQVDDGQVSSEPAVVSIEVTAVNDTPVADPQSIAILEDTSLDILLSGFDADSDPLTFTVVSNPLHGLLSGFPPDLVYKPMSNYFGTDSFTFFVKDGQVSSEPVAVEIKVTAVNDVPVANPQSLISFEDTSLDILLTGFDVDSDPLNYTLVDNPLHGFLNGVAPHLVYIPTSNSYGPDNFTFLVNDGQVNSALELVEIDVIPVNDAPVADPQSIMTRQSIPVEISLTGSDLDGDILIYNVITPPLHGTLNETAPNLIYTPSAGYAGVDFFTFVANDGELNSSIALVSIKVNHVVYVPITIR